MPARHRSRRSVVSLAVGVVAATAATLLAGVLPTSPPAGAAVPTPVVERRVLGYSVQHRAITAYRLGNASGTTAVLIGQMHGDERAGVAVTRALLGSRYSITGLNLWVIPMLNPDGYVAHRRQNAHGVDLNRNWPDRWAHLTGEYYSGPAPLSEPETRVAYDFLSTLHPHYVVVLHQPLYGVDTTDGGALDIAFRHRLSANLHLPEKAFRCWSVCHGSLTGWYTTHRYGIAETIEFGSAPSAAYLAGTVPGGIIHAMGGHFGILALHDPRSSLTVSATPGGAYVHGWAFDYDYPSAHVRVPLYRDGRYQAVGYAAAASPTISTMYHLPGSHGFGWRVTAPAGRHTYCVVFANIGAGVSNPRRCATITVG